MVDTQPIDPPPDSPTECSFTHTASYRDAVPLEKLRIDVETLSNSETLDKNAALQMTRLFHAMELYTTQEINARDARIASLQHELQQQRLCVELDRVRLHEIHDQAVMASTPSRPPKRRSW